MGPILKNENPNKSMTDISKLISAEWKVCPNKQDYVDKAAKLKAKYQIVLEEYQKTSDYRKYQKILQQWKEEQNETKKAKVKSAKKKKGRYQDSDSEDEYEQESDDGSVNMAAAVEYEKALQHRQGPKV